MNDLRAEQALRVLDAIESELKAKCAVVLTAIAWGDEVRLFATDEPSPFPGRNLLDALAQYAQALVSAGEPWGEPGALDAESDVDAFDRATGGQL
jgi:hypothetical protein